MSLLDSPSAGRPLRLRLLIWCNALAVSLIVLSELLVLDFALAWVARGYLGGAWTFQGVLIAGGILSLLACWRLLAMALRAERTFSARPDAVELPV